MIRSMLVQKICLSSSPKYVTPSQRYPGLCRQFLSPSPSTRRHGGAVKNVTPLKCSPETSICRRNDHREQSHGSLQGNANALLAADQPPAPRVLDVFRKKLVSINHLIRSYTWVNIIVGIVSISLLSVQSLADLTPRFFLEIFKAILPIILMSCFLTILNQIYDVEIDKINKPYLPLAAGDLSIGTALTTSIGCAILGFILAIMSRSPPLLWNVTLRFLCGAAYSLPLPFLRWKSNSFMASLAMITVMGISLPLHLFMHFQQHVLGRPFIITRPLIFTVAIMSLFAFVNGTLKDVSDVEGDKKFGMKTLSVIMGNKKVLKLCVNLMLMAYGGAILAGVSSSTIMNKLITIIGHGTLAIILWVRSGKVDVDKFESTFDFYMLIWKLTYVEYILIHFVR